MASVDHQRNSEEGNYIIGQNTEDPAHSADDRPLVQEENFVFQRDEIYQTLPIIPALYVKLLVMILTWYIKAEHKHSRLLGYADFYKYTRHYHRLTFYILSSGHVVLIIIASVTADYCLQDALSACSTGVSLAPVNYQQIIIVIEVACAVPFVIKHIVEVGRFNQREDPPDVLAGDVSYQLHGPQYVLRLRDDDEVLKVLERQADLIQGLKYRNAVLNQRVYALSQQLQQVEA
ncbi:transmembrane protein 192 isoform X2 [Oratosquilla oratoria]|uniref:transmembrane protein 192 isoform X2 n=1 Tax=Oratosquilla oratoria TaxID=337810 RepID=UPI003F75A2C8